MRGIDTSIALRIFAAAPQCGSSRGQTRDVQRMVLAGKKTIYGFRGDVTGKL